MSTFLRLELAGDHGDTVLINVDHIVRIHPCYPRGSSIVTSDITSVNVRASLEEIQQQMIASGGRITIKWIGHVNEHGVDEVYEAARADLVP